MNQLCFPTVAEQIFQTAARYDQEKTWYLILMLLMPDHLHALISVGTDMTLSTVIANFKRATTRFAGVSWQRNFFDHRIRDSGDPVGKENYILQNPVRAGLVSTAEQWSYVMDRARLEAMAVR